MYMLADFGSFPMMYASRNLMSVVAARRHGETQEQSVRVVHELLDLRGDVVLTLQYLPARQPEPGFRFPVPLHGDHEIVEIMTPGQEVGFPDDLISFLRAQRPGYLSCPTAPCHDIRRLLQLYDQPQGVVQGLLRLSRQAFDFS